MWLHFSIVLLVRVNRCIHHWKIIHQRYFLSTPFSPQQMFLSSLIVTLIQILHLVWHNFRVLLILNKCHVSVTSNDIGSNHLINGILRWIRSCNHLVRNWCRHLFIIHVEAVDLLLEFWGGKVYILDLTIHSFILLFDALTWTLINCQ